MAENVLRPLTIDSVPQLLLLTHLHIYNEKVQGETHSLGRKRSKGNEMLESRLVLKEVRSLIRNRLKG